MPYENEHACRLQSPEKYDQFARKNCDRKHDGKCIDVIYGKKGDGPMETQALRYPAEIWTASDARAHCSKEGGTFEAAQKEKKSNSEHAVLIKYVTNQAWALNYDTLEHLCNILERHVAGIKLSDNEITAITESKEKGGDKIGFSITEDGKAIIPITGIIAKYSSMVNGISSPEGTSIEQLNEQFDMALNNPYVKGIILKIESPGGSIAGVPEFANKVYRAGAIKPVIAFIDDFTASAAYWIASQATEIYASDVATVGSIGIYTVVVDSSERAKQLGLKFHIIKSGQNKGIGQPGIEITQENRDSLQEWINDSYEAFLSAIMRSRREAGLDDETLRGAADGRLFVASKAMDLKLIDGIESFEDILKMNSFVLRTNQAADGSAGNLIIDIGKDKIMDEKKASEAVQAAAAEKEKMILTAKTEGNTEGESRAYEKRKIFAERFSKNPAFALEQLKAGATIEAATAAYAAMLEKENAELARKAAEQKPATPAKAADPAVQSFADDASAKANQAKAPADTEEGWKEEFGKSIDLQTEFGKVETYVAYKKAAKEGRVKNSG